MFLLNKEKKFPAHLAVIKNQPELLQDNKHIYEENHLGLTPYDLAYHLNRRSCLKMLDNKNFTWNKFNMDFTTINFLPTLTFDSYATLKKIVKIGQKYINKGYFMQQRLWYGARYESEILENILPSLHIRYINDIIGFGLFANAVIKPGTFLGEYSGILKKRKKKLLKNNFYCMRYAFYENDFRYVIDASLSGNHTRFMNHSNNPNVTIKSAVVKNILRIIFIAIKPIKKDEQLVCHYGDAYWEDLKAKHDL